MKVVLNRCCGGFSISEEARKELGYGIPTSTDEKLVKLLEEKGTEYVSGECAQLEVFDIPEAATDFLIDECNGYETVYYVIDGKIEMY